MADEPKQTVLVVDDHESIRRQLYWALDDDYRVLTAASRSEAMALLSRNEVDVVLSDLRLPPSESTIHEGLAIIEGVKKFNPLLPIIVITGDEDQLTAMKVVQRGCYDILNKPVKPEIIQIIVGRASNHYQLLKENLKLKDQLRKGTRPDRIIGTSSEIGKVLDTAMSVAHSVATVLITGESGTGKEMLAHYIHDNSDRVNSKFIACNIAALPETLVESELFGHEKGAFTGASVKREGKFEQADGGTLFLDEIGELSASMQVKLLRVLQERQFERLGGRSIITVDIRIIAATNRNLEEMVETGEFRSDLYYRLNVINLELPPLRTRPDDIPILALHFTRKAAEKHKRPVPTLTTGFLDVLQAHHWPGNIRELENAIERAVIIGPQEIDERFLPEKIKLGKHGHANGQHRDNSQNESRLPLVDGKLPPDISFETLITDFKKILLIQALKESNGSRSEAAHKLKISRQYLHRLINELNIEL